MIGSNPRIKIIHFLLSSFPPGTQSGTVFKLKDQGMTSVRHKGRGNLYVTVKVVVPKKLNHKQKKLLKEFDEISGNEIHHVEKGLFDKVKEVINS